MWETTELIRDAYQREIWAWWRCKRTIDTGRDEGGCCGGKGRPPTIKVDGCSGIGTQHQLKLISWDGDGRSEMKADLGKGDQVKLNGENNELYGGWTCPTRGLNDDTWVWREVENSTWGHVNGTQVVCWWRFIREVANKRTPSAYYPLPAHSCLFGPWSHFLSPYFFPHKL